MYTLLFDCNKFSLNKDNLRLHFLFNPNPNPNPKCFYTTKNFIRTLSSIEDRKEGNQLKVLFSFEESRRSAQPSALLLEELPSCHSLASPEQKVLVHSLLMHWSSFHPTVDRNWPEQLLRDIARIMSQMSNNHLRMMQRRDVHHVTKNHQLRRGDEYDVHKQMVPTIIDRKRKWTFS